MFVGIGAMPFSEKEAEPARDSFRPHPPRTPENPPQKKLLGVANLRLSACNLHVRLLPDQRTGAEGTVMAGPL